jgi:hypothetical protein
MRARGAGSLWLGLLLGLLASCVPVPITPQLQTTTAQMDPTGMPALETGRPREAVLAALGGKQRVLATDRFEVYEIERVESYQIFVIIGALTPMPLIRDQTLHVLVRYDERGQIDDVAWERGAVGMRIPGDARSKALPLDRSENGIPGNASADLLVGWQGYRVHLGPEGRRALIVQSAAAPSRTIMTQLWDLEARAPLGPPVEPPKPFGEALALFDDGEVAGTCNYNRVCLWNALTGAVRWSHLAEGVGGFWDSPGFPVAMAAAPDGTRFAVSDVQPVLRLVDRTGTTLLSRRLTGLSMPAWAGDRAIVAEALPDGRVRFSDLADGRILLETAHHLRGSLTGMTDMMAFWRSSMIRKAAATAMPAEGLFALAPDGLRLALNRQTHVEVYARAEPTAPFRLWRVYLLPVFVDMERLRPLGTIGFAANGRRLAAGYGTLTVWDLDEDREILRLVPSQFAGEPVPPGEIDLARGFRFLPDGRRFVTANGLYAIVEPDGPALALESDRP